MNYGVFISIYEELKSIALTLLLLAESGAQKDSKIRIELKKLKRQLKKHEPIVHHLDQALKFTDKVFEENR